MAMNWAQARALADATLAADYADHDPPLALATWGWEGPSHFQVHADAQASLDGDTLAAVMDPPIYLVDKRTGRTDLVEWAVALDQRDEWTRVGFPLTDPE